MTHDEETELAAWAGVFNCGFDHGQTLPAIGVALDAEGRPDMQKAKAAWARLGDFYMAKYASGFGNSFAEKSFGAPDWSRNWIDPAEHMPSRREGFTCQ